MHEGSKSEQRAAALSLTRREAIERVSMLLGGVALVGQSALLGACASTRAPGQDASARSGALFTDADVALLDEIAETILPETSTPGAKAAGVGPFIALMVEDAYGERDQGVFVQGLRAVDEASETMHGVGFMAASAAQRLALLERLDAEQLAPARRARALFSDDERARAARVLHVRNRLYAGDALRRGAGTLRSVRAAFARGQAMGAARVTSVTIGR
jgi:hypothetical protein